MYNKVKINNTIKNDIVRIFADTEIHQIAEIIYTIDKFAKAYYGDKTFASFVRNTFDELAKASYNKYEFRIDHFGNVKKEWECVGIFYITLDFNQKIVGNDIVNNYKIVSVDFE
jgi:hypothetical protein